jgi:hypothetical protein
VPPVLVLKNGLMILKGLEISSPCGHSYLFLLGHADALRRKIKYEEEALKQERDLLGNAELRANLADHSYRSLFGEGEDDKGAIDLLNDALQAVTGLEKYDASVKALREEADSALAQADDLARSLRAYRDGVDHNPARLQQIDERLDLIFRLKRKYGDTAGNHQDLVKNVGERFEKSHRTPPATLRRVQCSSILRLERAAGCSFSGHPLKEHSLLFELFFVLVLQLIEIAEDLNRVRLKTYIEGNEEAGLSDACLVDI